ncbi:MAG: hypothetical protein ACXADA_13685 [Candidatus Hodarchaeales archaeon]
MIEKPPDFYPRKQITKYTVRKGNRLTIPNDIDAIDCYIGYSKEKLLLLGDLQTIFPLEILRNQYKLKVNQSGKTKFVTLGKRVRDEIDAHFWEGNDVTFIPSKYSTPESVIYELTSTFQECSICSSFINYNELFYSISVSRETVEPFSSVNVEKSYLTMIFCVKCTRTLGFSNTGELNDTVNKLVSNNFSQRLKESNSQL